MYKATQNQDHGISQNRIELEDIHSFITFLPFQYQMHITLCSIMNLAD